MVFFGDPPDLLGVDVVGEAGNDPLVFAAQHDHARVAKQVQRVASGQAPRPFVRAHIRGGSRVVVVVACSLPTWTVGAAPTIHPPGLEEEDEGELLRISLLSTSLSRGTKLRKKALAAFSLSPNPILL